MTPSPKPTRRERAARMVYVDLLPPQGKARTSNVAVGLVLLALLVVASALAAALESPELVPSLLAVTVLLYVLYVTFDFLGGT